MSRDPDKAVQFIIDNAPVFAQAKANRIHIEAFMKTKKALLMKESTGKTVSERETDAYADKEYRDLLEGLREAVEVEETLKWRMTAAEASIEVWRTREATNRAEGRVTR